MSKFFKSEGTDVVTRMTEMAEAVSTGQESPPHIAAIHGALVTQELIKFVTKRDPPLVNQIIINPTDCGAVVVKTPASLLSRVVSGDVDGDSDNDDVEVVNGASLDLVDLYSPF